MTDSVTTSFRAVEDADHVFLLAVYASTRAEEMAAVPWTDQEKDDFVRFQFEAQHTFYQEHFPDAEYLIVELGSEPIGRLYLDRRDDEHRLIDIALLPQYRRKGLGARLINDVLAEARSVDKLVRIHVEQNNPALRLYERLGFRPIEDQGVYSLMEWSPRNDES